jgi:predicted NBD/HSP70 family sugar kinase
MAVVAEGRLQSGGHGRAGELGHVPVVLGADALDCPCGLRGCLEAYASGSGLARRGAAHGAGAVEVVQAARDGIGWAVDLEDEALRLLAAALAGVIGTLDPEVVVLGGGLLRGAGWFDPLRTRLGDMLRTDVPELKPARHGEFSPLHGAAALARGDGEAWAFLGDPAR